MVLARIAAAVIALALAGCSSGTAPSAVPASTYLPPIAPGAGLQPTIAAVSPNVVSTAGAWGTITGTQFQPGATLRIGGAAVMVVFRDSTTIQFANSGAHAPGAADVVVTNPGALSTTLSGGYTFAPPESFDINGKWIAHADAANDYTIVMRFTIRDNTLVSLSCGTLLSVPITLSAENGRFSFIGRDGLAFSGTLVSTTTSSGHVNAPACGDGKWWADKASY